jgi:two-component system, OmpR family, KDP operon response regulator KdpE
LLARVHAAMRRVELDQWRTPQSVFRAGDLQIDLGKRQARVGDRQVRLTPTEYRLLCELVRQPGQVLGPAYLLERVWGPGYEGDDHLVWLAIHRLRRKIELDPDHPKYIQTNPGMGYSFAVP